MQVDLVYSNVHRSGQQEEGVVNLLFLLLLSLQKQLSVMHAGRHLGS